MILKLLVIPNDETNFPHKLPLTDVQVLRLCKAFASGSSATMELSKTRLHMSGQSGVFLGRLEDHYYELVCL